MYLISQSKALAGNSGHNRKSQCTMVIYTLSRSKLCSEEALANDPLSKLTLRLWFLGSCPHVQVSMELADQLFMQTLYRGVTDIKTTHRDKVLWCLTLIRMDRSM